MDNVKCTVWLDGNYSSIFTGKDIKLDSKPEDLLAELKVDGKTVMIVNKSKIRFIEFAYRTK